MRMRITFFLSTAALLALASCKDHLTGPPTNTVTAVSDTIAFYPHPLIDGKDASGNGHDGQIPPPGHVPVSGRDRFGVDSLTSDGPITVSNTTDLKFTDTDSYTVSAWFELFGSGGENPVISLPTGCTIEATIYGSSLQIDLLHVNSLGLIQDSMAGAISLPHGDTGNRPAGWHLVTVAVTGNSPSPYGLAVYIDSQLVGVGSSSTLAPSPKAYFPLFVGYMGLLVDDAVILKGAKSASWVTDRFHEGGWYEGYGTKTTGGETVPKPGSYFIMESLTDTNGVRWSQSTMDTLEITRNGLSIYGKSNVSEFGPGGHVSYEPNGDFSMYRPGGFSDTADFNQFPERNGWVTLPFASQTITSATTDTIVDGDTIHTFETLAGAGNGIITIKGNQIVTEMATLKTEYADYTTHTFDTTTDLYGYAPSLGMLVVQVNDAYSHPFNGDSIFVIDYQLK